MIKTTRLECRQSSVTCETLNIRELTQKTGEPFPGDVVGPLDVKHLKKKTPQKHGWALTTEKMRFCSFCGLRYCFVVLLGLILTHSDPSWCCSQYVAQMHLAVSGKPVQFPVKGVFTTVVWFVGFLPNETLFLFSSDLVPVPNEPTGANMESYKLTSSRLIGQFWPSSSCIICASSGPTWGNPRIMRLQIGSMLWIMTSR